MERYLLRETIRRFQEIMAEDISDEERRFAAAEIASMQRELALLDAAFLGVQKYPHQIGQASAGDKQIFQRVLEASPDALLIIDPRPGLHIVDMTDSFETTTMIERQHVVGEALFHAFPENPHSPDADGISSVLTSLRTAADTGDPQVVDVQRYDVRNSEGQFVERYWRPRYTPIFNGSGELVWLLVRLEDVTGQYRQCS